MMVVPARRLRQACLLLVPLLVVSLAGTACGPGQPPSPATAAPEVAPTRVPALTGLLTRPELQAYEGWQALLAEDYTPGMEAVESLLNLLNILDGKVVEPAPPDGGVGSCDLGGSCQVN